MASRSASVRLYGLLNNRVRDTPAGRAIFLGSHGVRYPVDRRLSPHLVRWTGSPGELALSSNQSIDVLSGFRGKNSRTFDFGSEPLESSDLLEVSVGRNKEKSRKSNHERCGIAQARQYRMEAGSDARGLAIGVPARAWSSGPVSCDDSHLGLLTLEGPRAAGHQVTRK
jgi:hypothetical protein